MFEFFSSFTKVMISSFRRIANMTQGEMKVEDLHGEAWIVASEISKKRGRDIDFSDPVDQNMVMGYIYTRHVRRGDWHMRKSIRIDQDRESDDGAIKWSERLPAPDWSDPLISILKREASRDADAKFNGSYSQAVAYVRALARFKNSRAELSVHLAISNDVLESRMALAQAVVQVQPSLFDGITKIGPRFMPAPGRVSSSRTVRHLGSVQWAWSFNECRTTFGGENDGDTLR